jgi:hypothetical protein
MHRRERFGSNVGRVAKRGFCGDINLLDHALMREEKALAKNLPSSTGAPASKSLLFMMIGLACGLSLLLSAGLITASSVIRAMRLRASSDKATVRTPIGEFRLEKATEVGPGMPVYPQASLVLPSGPSTGPVSNNDLPQRVVSIYHANTSREFILNWYVEHLSPEFVRQDAGPKNLPDVFRGLQIADDDIVFVGERGDQVRGVVLASDETGTKITLLRSVKPAAQ